MLDLVGTAPKGSRNESLSIGGTSRIKESGRPQMTRPPIGIISKSALTVMAGIFVQSDRDNRMADRQDFDR
jgi:hypothetical protein